MDWDFQMWMDSFEPSIPEFYPVGWWPLSEDERDAITDAATLAHMGDDDLAEQARERGGYGGLR